MPNASGKAIRDRVGRPSMRGSVFYREMQKYLFVSAVRCLNRGVWPARRYIRFRSRSWMRKMTNTPRLPRNAFCIRIIKQRGNSVKIFVVTIKILSDGTRRAKTAATGRKRLQATVRRGMRRGCSPKGTTADSIRSARKQSRTSRKISIKSSRSES